MTQVRRSGTRHSFSRNVRVFSAWLRRGRFIEHKTKQSLNKTVSWDFALFGESLETFHYSAKVSNLGKFFGFFWSNLTKNSGRKHGNVYFSCFTNAIIFVPKSLFILSGRPQLSTFRRKCKTLSYLDYVLCSMNRPQVDSSFIGHFPNSFIEPVVKHLIETKKYAVLAFTSLAILSTILRYQISISVGATTLERIN
jgi:hypothetical protein